MPTAADVIIIGSGVIGAATAFELAKAGFRTLTVDRNAAAGHGSTSGSCAIIRMHYSTFAGTAFAYEGYFYWRDWSDYLETADPSGLATFKETGCLVMATEANGYLEKHKDISREIECPYEEWDAARILKQIPGYSLERFAPAKSKDDPDFGLPSGGAITSGVFWPTAGYVTDPALSAQNLAVAAQSRGSLFRHNAEVSEILTANGRVRGVQLASGEEIHAPIVVNVAGPASSKINAMAGVLEDMTISTRALRQEVVHVPAPPGLDFDSSGIVISDSDIACYIRPEHGNNILVGSEDPPCDDHTWVEDDTDFNRDFTDQWTTQAMRYAQRLPSLGIPSRMRGVVDLYDVSDDWIPIYDKSSLPGFYMACGSSGNQYKNAPIAGKMMAALIDYCENGGDHDSAPLQFTLPRIGRSIDVGFYSRNREINSESSFSVLG
ncbi:NAD(P)/FAD-dependent oxidoreductase [Denitrobaculum tricleocarpae]|uniref:FAD-binding oxidoreductase n=1 Tax=Denitrobaculum tricleocarpae TaxID=2591009 RepID=A0A545TUH2_9PROT|nr:FAD-binding oxidoreductase [Denitrobaculum tricleocarpae]TQV80870.1 FAD-binding oxidoreductase [Denitrobaculum tricleocarpae]